MVYSSGSKPCRENLQSRVKEEDSITDVENAVFDLGVMDSLCFLFVDQRVFIGMITKFIKFIELNFSVITRGFDIKVCMLKGPYDIPLITTFPHGRFEKSANRHGSLSHHKGNHPKCPILRYNIRKSLARKGLQKNKSESARSDTEEDVEAYMDERVDEPSSEEFQMGSIPQGSAPAKIVKWQILKTGKKGAYQIIREDHTDVVYVNFQGLLNDLTRDDLKELYRLMMLKYGDSRPEEEYERVLWGDLKTMFDPPSTEDDVWRLTHQQMVLSWRYFHSCVVHYLTFEAAHIYMLTEVKYTSPSRVCQAMLEKKLIGDRKDECVGIWIEREAECVKWRVWHSPQVMACGKGFELVTNLTGVRHDSTKGLASPRANGYLVKALSNPLIVTKNHMEAHNEDTQRNLKFTSEDQVRGGLLGIIVNRLRSGSYRVKSGRHS
ncbi:hypothetical protein Tco_1400920 [Tanacetum coccineum]